MNWFGNYPSKFNVDNRKCAFCFPDSNEIAPLKLLRNYTKFKEKFYDTLVHTSCKSADNHTWSFRTTVGWKNTSFQRSQPVESWAFLPERFHNLISPILGRNSFACNHWRHTKSWAKMNTAHKNSMRGLTNFITDIRNCTSFSSLVDSIFAPFIWDIRS